MTAMVAGCAAPRPAYSVSGEDPTAIVPAIRIAVRTHDQTVVPALVKDLESEDPAVRFYANDGLQKLTGRDFGFLYYDEDAARQVAIQRWKAWLAQSSTTSATSHENASTQP